MAKPQQRLEGLGSLHTYTTTSTLSGQPLHPATANFSKDFGLGVGVPIGSLLGLSITKREQPRASGVFLLVVVLNTASAG